MYFSLASFLAILSTVTGASQSVAPDAGDAATTAIQSLKTAVHNHYLLHHDFLTCLQRGSFSNLTLATRIFAENHYVYSKNFKRYLTMVAEKVDDSVKHLLLENLQEEDGLYEEDSIMAMVNAGIPREHFDQLPHKVLITNFLSAVGVEADALNNMGSPGGRFTTWILNLYRDANACEALAIVGFAIEETVSILYQFIWDGLKKTDMNPQDYVFFPLHILVDDHHADLLIAAFANYMRTTPEACARAPELVMSVLNRRTQMLDELREVVAAAGLDQCDIPINSGRTNQLGAINRAKALTSTMAQPSWPRDQKMALSARILADAGHGYSLSGQISCRDDNETRAQEGLHFWTQVYGVPLEMVRPSDFILVNDQLEVVEGQGFPNLANRFHLHVYRSRPDIKCFVHTHPQWTNALSMTGKPLHIGHMDTMALYDQVAHIPDWPGVPFGDEEGEIIQTALGKDNWGVLAAHHGVMVGGRTIEEATYRAIFFEMAAEMQIKAMSAVNGNMAALPQVDRITAERAREWRISPGPVKAHFNSWARQALRKHGDVFQ